MSLIIKARNIRLDYAGRDVLDIDELEIHSYDRIGLVGDNGAGKSSLLKVRNCEIVLAEATLQRFGDFAHISQLGGIEIETVEDRAMLSRLGVSNVQNDTMSGGEETRAKIAAAFSQQVHGILADEPTSHLDLNGIDLLIGQLKAFDGALLVISHDRYFLDMVVDKIWELKDGKITEYWGGYSDYLRQKEEERQHQAVEYELMMKERERLESAVQEKRQQANRLDNKKKGEKSKAIVKKFGNYLYVKNNFFDFKINPELPSEELSGYSLEIKNTDGKLLSQYRTDSLSQREEATYVKIDQFVQKNNFDKKISFITNLLKGNLRYKMIDIDLNRLFEVNRYEGVRLGAGIKLNEKFSTTFSPDFYFGYGFRDHTWKYGGGIDVKLSQKRTSILRLEYINDVFAAGRLSKTFWDNAMKTPDIGLDIYNLNFYKSEQFGISYTYDLSNTLSAKLIASKEQQNALFPYQYKNMGNSFENFNTTLSLKYSPNDKNLMTPAGKYTYKKGFPQIFVNFEIGSELFGGQLNYQRIDALAIHQFRNKMGITNIKLFGGFSNGTAPIWKNFEITGQTNTNGNLRSRINTPSMLGFVTMPSGVFYTDRFVALQVSQLLPFQFKFGGKRTSSIQVEYQAAIGNHSNPGDHQFNFQVLNRPYQEIGFVWNRFLGTSLGVGASYRIGHYQTSEFKDNIGIQLKFGL